MGTAIVFIVIIINYDDMRCCRQGMSHIAAKLQTNRLHTYIKVMSPPVQLRPQKAIKMHAS